MKVKCSDCGVFMRREFHKRSICKTWQALIVKLTCGTNLEVIASDMCVRSSSPGYLLTRSGFFYIHFFMRAVKSHLITECLLGHTDNWEMTRLPSNTVHMWLIKYIHPLSEPLCLHQDRRAFKKTKQNYSTMTVVLCGCLLRFSMLGGVIIFFFFSCCHLTFIVL